MLWFAIEEVEFLGVLMLAGVVLVKLERQGWGGKNKERGNARKRGM